MPFETDLLVVGAGPAGSTAARVAAAAGLRVLLIDRRSAIGLPVQCAEYVPAQITGWTALPRHVIAQPIAALRTYLPNGEVADTAGSGYLLHRALFDKSLAVAACLAGAELWTGARAIERTERCVLVQRAEDVMEVDCRVIIGADGPRSTVATWIDQQNTDFLDTAQVEVVLPKPNDRAQVYFDAEIRGGYGWFFPKGETANVGVGTSRRIGGEPHRALAFLIDRLQGEIGVVLAKSGGLVPAGGPVRRMVHGNVLLIGDAAGQTHPITGAGIFAAVAAGTMAGRAVASALETGRLDLLEGYEDEWDSFMGAALRHAEERRRYLETHWSDDPEALSEVIRRTWIAFREYWRSRHDCAREE